MCLFCNKQDTIYAKNLDALELSDDTNNDHFKVKSQVLHLLYCSFARASSDG